MKLGKWPWEVANHPPSTLICLTQGSLIERQIYYNYRGNTTMVDILCLIQKPSGTEALWCHRNAKLGSTSYLFSSVIFCFRELFCFSIDIKPRFMGPSWGPSGADRTQVGPCWPHEPCYLGSQLLTTQTQHQANLVLIICIPISRHDGNHEVIAVIVSKISSENQVLYAKKNIIQSASYMYCKLHVVLLSTFVKKNFSYLHYWNELHVFCFS